MKIKFSKNKRYTLDKGQKMSTGNLSVTQTKIILIENTSKYTPVFDIWVYNLFEDEISYLFCSSIIQTPLQFLSDLWESYPTCLH